MCCDMGLCVATLFSSDKLWKCRNMALFVATGFRVLCLDSVATGFSLGRGFLSRD